MLAKHPSTTKPNVEKDEINNIESVMATRIKLTDTSITTRVMEERVKAAAKLEGVSTDKILSRIKNQTNIVNVSTNISINDDRLSKESGIGSSVGSSYDEKDDEIDHYNNDLFNSSSSQSTTNTSFSTENAKISPRVSQQLDDLDDTMTKFTNDNKNSLGIITEEEESSNHNNSINNISRSRNHNSHNNHNNSFFKKHHQHRITFSDNLDSNSESITESSTLNDTESSTSGEPDSPSLLNNLSVSANHSSKIEHEKRKNSFKRKNSSRSIFSVLSPGSLRSPTRGSQSGSLSDPEDSSSHQRFVVPGSPLKSGRSGFSSLSIRRRRSKPILSIALSDDGNYSNKLSPPGLSTSRPGSPENNESLSKAGKILGLTISEDKILLDKPNNKATKKSREVSTISSSSSDEKILSSKSAKSSNSNKTSKILGYDDSVNLTRKPSKVIKILGLDDEPSKRSPSMYIDKMALDLGIKSNSNSTGTGDRIESLVTVASIKKHVIYKGFLTRYTNPKLLSKSWKNRYFVLAKNTLYCFKSSDNNSPLVDQFELTASSVVCVNDGFNGRSWVLQIGKANQKPWYIQADSAAEMKTWLTELKSIVVKCNSAPETPSHLNSTDKLLRDDYDDYDYDYNDIEDKMSYDSSNNKTTHPTKLVDSPKLSSSYSIDDNSIDPYSLPPPPRPPMMTSLPPPPRSRSAPSSPSCPPSPDASLSPPTRPMSPSHHVPVDVKELSNGLANSYNELEIPKRSSSPVETLSPPRARYGTQSHQHKGSISSTYSVNSTTPRHKQRSNSANSSLSISTTSSIQQSSPHHSPGINNSPRKLARNSSTSSHRESIPIMMPSWGIRTTSSANMLYSYDNLQLPSLSYPHTTHLTNPHKPPEGPKPPTRINPDRHLTRSPPPNIPLPQPPPRPKNTLTSASRATTLKNSNNHNSHNIPSIPILSHPPPPIPPPRRPSTDGRMGGKGTNSAVTNLPVPVQNLKPASTSSPSHRRPSLERTMTLPINLPSYSSSHALLPNRSRSPPPLRNNITSMVYSTSPQRFQAMPINFSSMFAPLPPPTRPPNVPLPPIPDQHPPSSSTMTPPDTTDDRTKDTIISPATTMKSPIEFPDDDDLDPDYADELAASRIRSQKTHSLSSLSSSDATYFSAASNDSSSGNHKQQLSASGLTFVMVEETLGDGELVLDLQDVGENHPHVIRSSSRSNIRNDFLIRNDDVKNISRKNSLANVSSNIVENSEGKENSKGKEKEIITELEGKSVEDNTVNDVINENDNEKVEIVNDSDKNNISPSMLSI